jgi:hypothetical protein
MLGAAVPKASVDEDCDSCAREDDVRLAAEVVDGSSVLEESKPSAVELAPNCYLGARVLPAVPAHDG